MNFDNDNILDFNEFRNQKEFEENPEEIVNEFFDLDMEFGFKEDDLCPCGSGKKYKNCCANIIPEQPEEYYYMQLSNQLKKEEIFESPKKLQKTFELVQKAVQEHPVNPVFTEMAGNIAAELGERKQAIDYLMRSYRILQENLTLDNLLYITNVLADLGAFEQVEEIGENLKDNYSNHSFYLLLAEAKFILGKKEAGYKNLLKAYESSDNNIYVLNSVIKILVSNSYYNKALKLLKENYHRLQKIDPSKTEEEDVIILIENSLKDLFNIRFHGETMTDTYLKYLDKLINIFENIPMDRKINKKEINNIKKLLSNNESLPLFIVKLFYIFENYQWLSNNRDIIFKKANKREQNMINNLMINADFSAGNYENVLEYKDYLYNKKFIKSYDSETIFSVWGNYLLSLYHLQKDRKIIEFLKFIDKNIPDETLLIIHNLLSNIDDITAIKVLQYVKKVDNNWGFNILDSYEIVDIQLTRLFYNLQLIDNPLFCKEENRLAKKLLKEYEKYNSDNFIYHYAKWLLNKSEGKEYKLPLDDIVNKPIKKNLAVPLRYSVALKILGPDYVLNNSFLRKNIKQDYLEYLDTIAKIKKGEIKDLSQVFDQYPERSEELFATLQAILTEKEMDKLLSNY